MSFNSLRNSVFQSNSGTLKSALRTEAGTFSSGTCGVTFRFQYGHKPGIWPLSYQHCLHCRLYAGSGREWIRLFLALLQVSYELYQRSRATYLATARVVVHELLKVMPVAINLDVHCVKKEDALEQITKLGFFKGKLFFALYALKPQVRVIYSLISQYGYHWPAGGQHEMYVCVIHSIVRVPRRSIFSL